MIKNFLLLGLLSFIVAETFSQNKTLGVGTTTPNPNAALHVESPTNNQGFIMPRLTTANRTSSGFQGVLTASDIGLMVYDTDLKAIYIWDGAAWGSAAKLAFPYQDSILTAPANSNLLKLYYGGTAPGNVGVAYFENLNPNNAFGPLFVRTNGTGSASNFFINNAANSAGAVNGTTNGSGPGIRGLNTGTGNAANFTISNAANTLAALRTTTNGSGPAINASNTGLTDGFAGLFSNTQATNTYPAIQASTVGTGTGVRVIQSATSVGGGMDVFMQNSSGSAIGFSVDQQGLGPAVNVAASNTGSTAPALSINHSGTGNAITANRPIQATQFIGDGSGLTNLPAVSFPFSTSVNNSATLFDVTNTGAGKAANFSINNASNADNTLRVTTNGTGDNGWFEVTNASSTGSPVVGITNGLGAAGYFQGTNKPNGGTALVGTTNSDKGGVTAPVGVYGESTGTGSLGGSFRVNNPGNVYPALYAETNGTGTTIYAKQISTTSGNAGYFEVSNAANPATGVYAKTFGTGIALSGLTTGTGTAGRFEISNASNTSAALEAVTNGTGNAGNFQINNSSNIQEAVVAITNGLGNAIAGITTGTGGRGGYFGIANASNAQAGLTGETNGTGPAISANQTNGGLAIELLAGGIRLSTATYSAPVTITSKAALYEITSGSGNVDLPSTGPVGETCWVSNATATAITVNSGPGVGYGSIKQFIRLTGGWQIVN